RSSSQQSTSPASDQKRWAASANSIRHGLRSYKHTLQDECPVELEKIRTDLFEHFQPSGPIQIALVTRLWRVIILQQPLARYLDSKPARQMREAGSGYLKEQNDQVAAHEELLRERPHEAVRLLKESAAGCRYLLSKWDEICIGFDREGYFQAHSALC